MQFWPKNPDDPDVLALAQPGPSQRHILVSGVPADADRSRSIAFICKVSGIEKLPKSGAYIISSNHQSYLDPLILASVLPPEVFVRAFAVGTSEIFGKGLMRKLARSIKVVVLDPDANLVPAMRAGAFGLRHGLALDSLSRRRALDRRHAEDIQERRGHLSIHMQVPIVPVAIDGFYEAWPRNQAFQRIAP